MSVGFGILQRPGRNDASQSATALNDSTVYVSLCQRRGYQRLHASCTGTMSEDGHIVRVATKDGNVVLHPFQGGQLVEQTVIARTLSAVLGREQRVG